MPASRAACEKLLKRRGSPGNVTLVTAKGTDSPRCVVKTVSGGGRRHGGRGWIVGNRRNEEQERLIGRRPQQRQPLGVCVRIVVVVLAGAPDGRVGTPEAEVILGVEARDPRIGDREVHERQNASRSPRDLRVPAPSPSWRCRSRSRMARTRRMPCWSDLVFAPNRQVCRRP